MFYQIQYALSLCLFFQKWIICALLLSFSSQSHLNKEICKRAKLSQMLYHCYIISHVLDFCLLLPPSFLPWKLVYRILQQRIRLYEADCLAFLPQRIQGWCMNNESNAVWQRNGITKLKISKKRLGVNTVLMLSSCICILKEGLFFCLSLEMLSFLWSLTFKKDSVGLSFLPNLFSLFSEFRWHFCYKTVTLYKLEEYSGY